MLCSFHRGRPLLPNLRHIGLHDGDFALQAEKFIGPRIKEVKCSIPWVDWMVEWFLLELLCNSPFIEEFEFVTYEFKTSPELPYLEEFVCGLRNLRSLRIEHQHFTKRTIMHLADLPTLTTLEGYYFQSSDASLFTSSGGYFRALSHFALWIDDWSSCADLIRSMSSPLSVLEIHYAPLIRPLPLAHLAKLIDTISRNPCSTTLSELGLLGRNGVKTPTTDVKTRVYEAFRPLFSCKALYEVVLELTITSELDNDWLEAASHAWPLLRTLALDNIRCNPPKMTLAGLIPVVKRCRDLEVLDLALHMEAIDSSLLDGVSNSIMDELYLRTSSTIAEPVFALVRTLIALFPSISSVERSEDDDDADGEFDDLDRHLDGLRTALRLERQVPGREDSLLRWELVRFPSI